MTDDSDRKIVEALAARREAAQKARHRRATLSIVVVSIITVLIASLFWLVLSRQPHEVSGIVRCLSGAPVQGIYVKEVRGGGSFADPKRDPTNPSVARFSSEIRGTRQFGVNIGCGPLDAPKWTHEPKSDYEPRGYHEFECHDDPRDELYGKCITVK